jgi:hypothetical protein
MAMAERASDLILGTVPAQTVAEPHDFVLD